MKQLHKYEHDGHELKVVGCADHTANLTNFSGP